MKTAIELAEVAGSFLPEEKGYFLMQEMSAMLRQQAKENERLQADLTTQAEINAVVTQLARKNAVECDSLKAALNDVTSRQEADKPKEQPAQEPVGKFLKATYGDYAVLNWHPSYVAKIGDCLYARPAPTQPALSDDEIWQFWCNRPEVPEGEDDSMEAEFVAACKRAIEAHCRGGTS